MDDEWQITTFIRNRELSAQLAKFWKSERMMFERDLDNGLTVGLIPQIFNMKVTVGKTAHKEFGYLDGY